MPKPHTPFQWAAQCDHETVDARLRGARRRAARRPAATAGRSGYRYHDGKPSIIEGLLSRGDRRVAKVIRAAWPDGARFDGWSEYFSFERWERCAARGAGRRAASTWPGTPPGSATTARCCPGTTWTPGWTGTGSGRTGRTPSTRPGAAEVEDCRWTPCYDCGVCPTMGTEIQTGPTGARLLPLTVVGARARRSACPEAGRLDERGPAPLAQAGATLTGTAALPTRPSSSV